MIMMAVMVMMIVDDDNDDCGYDCVDRKDLR